MRKVSIFILTFLLIQNIFSQDNIVSENRIAINIVPTSILDTYPRIRFGLDYKMNQKMSFGFDYGFGNSSIIGVSSTKDSISTKEKYSVFEIRPEIKLYLNHSKKHSWYLATEFFYIEKHRIYNKSYYKPENLSHNIYYETAKFNVIKRGMHLKAGLELILGEIVKFDFYGGVGFAYRSKYYTDVVFSETEYDHKYLWYEDGYKKEKTSFIPHLSLGVRIGFIVFEK